MDRHVDARFVARGHDAVQEIDEVFKELFVRDVLVLLEEPVELFGGVAFVPAGKAQVVLIELLEVRLLIGEADGAVFLHIVKVGAEPIEDGHEVVADTFHAEFAEISDGFRIVFDEPIARGLAELDVLMHGDGLDDFHLEPGLFAELFEAGDLVARPDFAHGDVVNSRDDARQIGDLLDVGKRDAVALPVPAEGHFHHDVLLCLQFL